MSITVISQPSNVNFARNHIGFQVSTNNRTTTAGVKEVFRLQFSSAGSAGEYIAIYWEEEKVLLTYAVTPDNSGYQIPTNSGGLPVNEWLQEHAIPAMKANYLLSRDWDITYGAAAPGVYDAVFTAREAGVITTALSTNQSSGLTPTTQTQGVDPVLRENFTIVCQLFIGSGTKVVELEEVPDSLKDRCAFLLQEYLSPNIQAYIPIIGNSNPINITAVSASVSFYLKYGEKFGDPEVVQKLTTSDTFHVIQGGAAKEDFHRLNLLADINGAVPVPFLTNQPRTKRISRSQEDFLYIWFGADYSITILTTVYLADGSASGASQTFNPGANELYLIPTGYSARRVDLIESGTGQTAVKYEVKVRDGVDISETFTYLIDQREYESEKIFWFQNSFGLYETLRCTGDSTEFIEVEYESGRRVLEYNYSEVTTPELFKHSTRYRKGYKVNTGNLTQAEKKYMQELLLSLQGFEIIDGTRVPIVITTNKADLQRQFSTGPDSLEFEYVYAFENTNYGQL